MSKDLVERIVHPDPKIQAILDVGLNSIPLRFRMLSPGRWKQCADQLDGRQIEDTEKTVFAKVRVGEYLLASLHVEREKRLRAPSSDGKINLMKLCRYMLSNGLIALILQGHEFIDATTGGSLKDFDRILVHAGFGGDKNRLITVQMLRDWHHEADVPDAESLPLAAWYTADEYVSLARHLKIADTPKTRHAMTRQLETLISASATPDMLKRVEKATLH